MTFSQKTLLSSVPKQRKITTLKIYNIIATRIIILIVYWVVELRNELTQTKEVLEQCADRYYETIGK